MEATNTRENLWSLVLAGGDGERTRPFIERWLGCHLPKQYCTFVGTRSMLEHTWDRADRIAYPERRVTVIARQHHGLIWSHLEKRPRRERVVFQPCNRDTAAGIFLPLTYVRKWDPGATIILFPSDHFVFPEECFVTQARRVAQAARSFTDRVILLGITPTSLELEYGWIEPGDLLPQFQDVSVYGVRSFLEKPGLRQAMTAMSRGALWNSLVLAGGVETLWELGWQCFPDIMVRFDQLAETIGTSREGRTLDTIYEDMPRRNFSSDLLQKVPDRVGVVELQGVLWSDWGNPARIFESLQGIGEKAGIYDSGSFPVKSKFGFMRISKFSERCSILREGPVQRWIIAYNEV